MRKGVIMDGRGKGGRFEPWERFEPRRKSRPCFLIGNLKSDRAKGAQEVLDVSKLIGRC